MLIYCYCSVSLNTEWLLLPIWLNTVWVWQLFRPSRLANNGDICPVCQHTLSLTQTFNTHNNSYYKEVKPVSRISSFMSKTLTIMTCLCLNSSSKPKCLIKSRYNALNNIISQCCCFFILYVWLKAKHRRFLLWGGISDIIRCLRRYEIAHTVICCSMLDPAWHMLLITLCVYAHEREGYIYCYTVYTFHVVLKEASV